MAEIGKIVGLRCPHCGAALPETTKELVKCNYCGTTARIEDADKYLRHLQGFVIEWVRTALSVGIGVASSSSIDPLARHSIFTQNVFPSLNSEFSKIQLEAFEAFSVPLIAPPFIRHTSGYDQQKDPKYLFSYDAKVSSVQPLAVTQDDQGVVQKFGGLSRAFAHVLIGLDLAEKNQIRPYRVIAENFVVAAKSLEGHSEILSKRMLALSEIYLAIDEALSKQTTKSRARVNNAKIILEEVLLKSALDINLSICSSAIEQEIEVAKTVLLINDLIEYNGTGDQMENVDIVEKLFSTTSTICQTSVPSWRHRFENLGRYSELAKWLYIVLGAKRGSSSIKIANGFGNTLFPFWVAEIDYTFSTGALWMRKGKYVKEAALVAATFPLYQNFAVSPSEVVTDIFSRRPEGAFIGSITGSENAISTGENIKMLVQRASLKSASGYKIVPPLSTVSEANQLMNEYLQQVSRALGGKLHVASCDMADILFVPADLATGFINFQGSLGYVQPRKVGDVHVINSIVV
jgi:hypothetical protein